MHHDNVQVQPGIGNAPEMLAATFRRAGKGEARILAKMLSEDVRAKLALFCYVRDNLRDVGLTLASACSEQALVNVAGTTGHTLFVQAGCLTVAAPPYAMTECPRGVLRMPS
jgi:hypothetical protein